MDDLQRRVEEAGRVIETLAGVMPPATVARLENEHTAISKRLGYLGSEVVVALVGGTGSGKSSLLNAIAGETVARAGVIRPTTAEPLAWIPSRPDPGLSRLLNDLGIVHRVSHHGDPWLVVIDLPDIDSVERGHRKVVEQLLPRIDVIAWVVDPEKYSDRVLHEDFIAPLARYQDQFVFVLNQVDRVAIPDRSAIVGHLTSRLRAIGIEGTVIPVAAAPPAGGAVGLEALVDHLSSRFEEKDTVRRKLAIDLHHLVLGIRDHLGGEAPAVAPWGEISTTLVAGSELLLAPPSLDAAFEKAGRITASLRTSGPLGLLLGLLRRGGRAIGVNQAFTALEETTSRWRERQGRAELEGAAASAFMDAAIEVGPTLGAGLRSRAGHVQRDIDAALDSARRDASPSLLVSPHPWWEAFAFVSWLATAGVVGALAWGWFDRTAIAPGDGFDPVLLGAASLALGLLVRWVVRGVGTRAGRRAGLAYRVALRETLRRSLFRRLGEPYDEHAGAAHWLWKAVDDFLDDRRDSSSTP